MIGADTNVVIRMFVSDNPAQADAARALIEAEERAEDPILLTPLVVAEIEWSLRSNFDHTKPEILAVFDQIAANAGFILDDREAIEAAIAAWRTGRADFADYLIAALARERGARTTMTFDRAAAQTAAFTLLAAS